MGGRISVLLFAVMTALSATAGSSGQSSLNESLQQIESATTEQERVIKITIATAGPMLGPPRKSFRPGEQVPIAITMTNTSNQPVYVCVSSDLYQDLPTLTRDGTLVPFTKWQSSDLKNAQQNQTCGLDNLPERILLKPNEPAMVDWFVLVDDNSVPSGAMPWYDSLTPGVYDLSIQRRLGCCDGPMVSSNTISFEVAR
jgi:hypothetical protein